MIFYIATEPNGKKHIFTVEAEAKKLDKSYTQIDQPNDKASLKALIQESFDHIHDLEQQLESAGASAVGTEVPAEQVAGVGEPADAQADGIPPTRLPVPNRPASYVNWTIETETNFARLPLAHQLSLAAGALERARDSEALCRQADAITESLSS